MKPAISRYRTIVHATPLGSVAINWNQHREVPTVTGILLSRPEEPAESRARRLYGEASINSCPAIDALCNAINASLHGDAVKFSTELLDLECCTLFQRRVLLAQHGIPYGEVCTYRNIAAKIGNPQAARAVGNALASNPFPLVIPCHRTIRADGSIGGFQGGTALKIALLGIEGHRFSGGRIHP